MSKFKVGDKVKVKEMTRFDGKAADRNSCADYSGKETVVIEVIEYDDDDFRYKLHGCNFNLEFREWMLKPVVVTDAPTAEEDGLSQYGRNIVKLLRRQHQKGLKKYGETLEQNVTLSREQRIEHLQEELIDGLQYCEHIKAANDSLTVADYQRMAMRTANPECHNPANFALGLAGEAGECADIVKKHLFQGHELDKEHLAEELGDVAWYIALAADTIGISMEEILLRNVSKLKRRYPEGFDKARSINRNVEAEK